MSAQRLRAPAAPARTAVRPAAPWRPGTWNPQWRRANWIDYALTAAAAAGYAWVWTDLVHREDMRNWRGGVLLDEPIRHALAVRDGATREALTVSTEVAIGTLMLWPLVVDPGIALIRRDPGLAWELAWQAALVHLFHGGLQAAIRHPIGRERPSYYFCETHGENCDSRWAQNQSFPSGHSSTAFSAAALICTQHMNVRLYGGAADLATCLTAFGAAAFVGTARIISDDHWATDVLVGAALGSLVGWGVPTLLHYAWRLPPPGHSRPFHFARHRDRERDRRIRPPAIAHIAALPSPVANAPGVVLSGAF